MANPGLYNAAALIKMDFLEDGLPHRETSCMNHRAYFFLPKLTQSTRLGNAGLFSSNAGRLHEEKTDFGCLGCHVKKIFNHAYEVTAVTDVNKLTLLMFSYSAGSIFEFATGFSSGEIQVDSRPSLNRANFPGRNYELKELDVAENGSPHRLQREQQFSEKYPVQQAQRPESQFSPLKTATSAFQVYLLPAANAFNQ